MEITFRRKMLFAGILIIVLIAALEVTLRRRNAQLQGCVFRNGGTFQDE